MNECTGCRKNRRKPSLVSFSSTMIEREETPSSRPTSNKSPNNLPQIYDACPEREGERGTEREREREQRVAIVKYAPFTKTILLRSGVGFIS